MQKLMKDKIKNLEHLISLGTLYMSRKETETKEDISVVYLKFFGWYINGWYINGWFINGWYTAYGVYNFTAHTLRSSLQFFFRLLTTSPYSEYKCTKLLNQGFVKNRLLLSFKRFFGRSQQLGEKYSVSYVDDERL
jgi:hypothetical protein